MPSTLLTRIRRFTARHPWFSGLLVGGIAALTFLAVLAPGDNTAVGGSTPDAASARTELPLAERARALGPDLLAVPVRVEDEASVALVHEGDLVDVFAAGAADPLRTDAAHVRVVARAATVLEVVGDGSGGMFSASQGPALLVLAVDATAATALAGAASQDRLSLALRADPDRADPPLR